MAPKTLFSEVDGIVTMGGAPVAGAVVQREYVWTWNKSTGGDSTTTDAGGAFRFSAIMGRSMLGSVLPHEPLVEQKIRISHGGQSYEAWIFTKRNYDANGELNGKPIRLSCDLGAPAQRTETGPSDQGFFGICRLR